MVGGHQDRVYRQQHMHRVTSYENQVCSPAQPYPPRPTVRYFFVAVDEDAPASFVKSPRQSNLRLWGPHHQTCNNPLHRIPKPDGCDTWTTGALPREVGDQETHFSRNQAGLQILFQRYVVPQYILRKLRNITSKASVEVCGLIPML